MSAISRAATRVISDQTKSMKNKSLEFLLFVAI